MKKRVFCVVLLVVAVLFAGCAGGAGGASSSEVAIGEKVVVGDWEITLHGYEFTDTYEGTGLFEYPADDGFVYLVADLTVKNNGDESQSFLGMIRYTDEVDVMVLVDGEEFDSNLLTGESAALNKTFDADEEKTGVLCFEVPEDAETSDAEMVLQVSLGKEKYVYDLR